MTMLTKHKHLDKGDNRLIKVVNFTPSFLLTRFSAFIIIISAPWKRV